MPFQASSIVPLLAPADGTHGHDVSLLGYGPKKSFAENAHVRRGTLSSRYVPNGHVAQLRPSSADSPPSGHAMHSPAPSYGLNLPAPHGSQLSPAPASPEYPAGHTQLDALVLPSGDAAPLGHALHASGPAASLYVLAAHGAQLSPLAASPVKPGAHSHAASDVLPGCDTV